MRNKITALAAAGLLLFAACGGDDDDDTATDDATQESDGGESNAAGSGGDGSGSEFCQQAMELFQPTGEIDPEAQLEAAKQIEPPSEIAEDWTTLIDGSQAAAEANANLDPNDPDAQAEFQEQYQDLMDASTSVYAYMGEECGMEGFTPPVTDGASAGVPTTMSAG